MISRFRKLAFTGFLIGIAFVGMRLTPLLAQVRGGATIDEVRVVGDPTYRPGDRQLLHATEAR